MFVHFFCSKAFVIIYHKLEASCNVMVFSIKFVYLLEQVLNRSWASLIKPLSCVPEVLGLIILNGSKTMVKTYCLENKEL